MKRAFHYTLLYIIIGLVLSACSSSRFMPQGSFLLNRVKIVSDVDTLSKAEFRKYVRQNPNSRWFSLFKVPLGVYCGSTTAGHGWWSKMCRKLGEAPVVYDSLESVKSADNMKRILQNKGFMGGQVDVETKKKRHKVDVFYHLKPGNMYIVNTINYQTEDPMMARYFNADSLKSLLYPGMNFSIDVLNAARDRIANHLQNEGFYKFEPNYITFDADTVQGTCKVDLTMKVALQKKTETELQTAHTRYKYGQVNFVLDADILNSKGRSIPFDSLTFGDYKIYYKQKLRFRPKFLAENLMFQPGDFFSEQRGQATRGRFGRMRALNYVNIIYKERPAVLDSSLLDTYILLNHARSKSISAELEGTNTAGDLGAAATLSFEHKNIFKGAEVLTLKLRGAYEAITGLEGYSNENYTEWSGEVSLKFPTFKFPFLKNSFKKKIKASTEIALQYDMQNRPEFKRRVASANFNYQWTSANKKFRHKVDLMNLDYVYMPWISDTFRKEYLDSLGNQNAILKYNYQNLFIASMGYSMNYNSHGGSTMTGATYGTNAYAARAAFESAGNILYPISRMVRMQKKDGAYAFFNVPYAQYVKGDFDFVKSVMIDLRNSFAFHIGMGVAVPYGNSKILPFEKRYFSGGANSVRGWNVRTLGPGAFHSRNNNIDFINQTGDIRLDMNVEYRTFLFWKLHGAIFIDAGNIWTIRDYADQPGGVFKLNEFYKQIAVAYGLGLRFNFDYFILRFDAGMKAVNPAYPTGKAHYPISHPDFRRDFAFHFAVGLPF